MLVSFLKQFPPFPFGAGITKLPPPRNENFKHDRRPYNGKRTTKNFDEQKRFHEQTSKSVFQVMDLCEKEFSNLRKRVKGIFLLLKNFTFSRLSIFFSLRPQTFLQRRSNCVFTDCSKQIAT